MNLLNKGRVSLWVGFAEFLNSKSERGKPESVIILNRIVTVTENGLERQADQRLEQILMRDVGIHDKARSEYQGKWANARRTSPGRECTQSSGGERTLVGPGSERCAGCGEGDLEVHVEAGGAGLEKPEGASQVVEGQPSGDRA
jgi:hypothetical protein